MIDARSLTPFLCLSVWAVAPERAASQATVPAGLEASVDSLIAAYGRADGPAVASFYLPDAILLTGGELLAGAEISAALTFHFERLAEQRFDLGLLETSPYGFDLAVYPAGGEGTSNAANRTRQEVGGGTLGSPHLPNDLVTCHDSARLIRQLGENVHYLALEPPRVDRADYQASLPEHVCLPDVERFVPRHS